MAACAGDTQCVVALSFVVKHFCLQNALVKHSCILSSHSYCDVLFALVCLLHPLVLLYYAFSFLPFISNLSIDVTRYVG